MESVYSTYEAKTKFSELLRKVRQGGRVVITFHGEPVAEIRPIEKSVETFEERLDRLKRKASLAPGCSRASERHLEADRSSTWRPAAIPRRSRLSIAYVDTSCLVAILLAEPGSRALRARPLRLDLVFQPPRSRAPSAVFSARVSRSSAKSSFTTCAGSSRIARWARRSRRVFASGQLRGADAWHLGLRALLSPDAEITFLSLDAKQREVAAQLGFEVEP